MNPEETSSIKPSSDQPPSNEEVLEVALAASKLAAKIITDIRNSSALNISEKSGNHDIVTQADLAAEKAIIETIKGSFPDHKFLAEESSNSLTDFDFTGPVWIIDPIDGTTNFSLGQPLCSISIAFAWDGVVQVGVINCCFADELFTAIKGQGALLNGTPISVGKASGLRGAVVATGTVGFRKDPELLPKMLATIGKLLPQIRDIRRTGACTIDMAWVACGRLDGYFESVNPWDAAAGTLLIKEAGGVVSVMRNMDQNRLLPEDLKCCEMVCGNEAVHAALIKALGSTGKASGS